MSSQHLLFRQEAIDFQQHHRQWGQVALLQPLSTKIITWFIAAVVALVVVFLFLATIRPKRDRDRLPNANCRHCEDLRVSTGHDQRDLCESGPAG